MAFLPEPPLLALNPCGFAGQTQLMMPTSSWTGFVGVRAFLAIQV